MIDLHEDIHIDITVPWSGVTDCIIVEAVLVAMGFHSVAVREGGGTHARWREHFSVIRGGEDVRVRVREIVETRGEFRQHEADAPSGSTCRVECSRTLLAAMIKHAVVGLLRERGAK